MVDPTVKKTTDQLVKLTVILFLIVTMYTLISEFKVFKYAFRSLAQGDPMFYYFIEPFIFYFITLFLIWKKSKTGWVFFILWMFSVSAGSFLSMIGEISRGQSYSILDDLLPSNGWGSYAASFIIYGAVVVFYFSKRMREYFNLKSGNQEIVTGNDK